MRGGEKASIKRGTLRRLILETLSLRHKTPLMRFLRAAFCGSPLIHGHIHQLISTENELYSVCCRALVIEEQIEQRDKVEKLTLASIAMHMLPFGIHRCRFSYFVGGFEGAPLVALGSAGYIAGRGISISASSSRMENAFQENGAKIQAQPVCSKNNRCRPATKNGPGPE